MDLFELRWGELIGASFECFQLVSEVEFFEEPENALGAGLFEPVG